MYPQTIPSIADKHIIKIGFNFLNVKNTVHNNISNKDLESLKPERIFAGNLVVLKIESTSDGSSRNKGFSKVNSSE